MRVANKLCHTDVTSACEMDAKNKLIHFYLLSKIYFTSSRTSYCSTSPLSLAARLHNETERDNTVISKSHLLNIKCLNVLKYPAPKQHSNNNLKLAYFKFLIPLRKSQGSCKEVACKTKAKHPDGLFFSTEG